MGFLISFVKNDEIRPSITCQLILERREERNQLNSRKKQLVICSSAFWKQKCENLKKQPNIFQVIYQTRGRVFPPISKHREVGWKNEAQPSFLSQL